MDLHRWLWNNRISQRKLADDLGMAYSTVTDIVRQKHTPNLILALLIWEYTNYEVDIYTFLTSKDKERLDTFIQSRKSSQS